MYDGGLHQGPLGQYNYNSLYNSLTTFTAVTWGGAVVRLGPCVRLQSAGCPDVWWQEKVLTEPARRGRREAKDVPTIVRTSI